MFPSRTIAMIDPVNFEEVQRLDDIFRWAFFARMGDQRPFGDFIL